jgi:hypothetical protein
MTEDRRQRTKDRGQKTKDRGQRTDDRKQRTERSGQMPVGRGIKNGMRKVEIKKDWILLLSAMSWH